MPEPSTPPAAAAPSTPRDALRIVLFGMPDAGKSSLLGALAQAAQTQEHVLNGRLVDHSQGLADLQRRLYEERPRETLEEVVPYHVTLESFAAPGAEGAKTVDEVVLVDCDGRVANELLARQRSLAGGPGDGALVREILAADTLVLVIDGSSTGSAIDRDFAQFGQFLRLLEQSRGQRSEVGGLPVYLVLTKCDLLARPGDAAVAWIDRVEEKKRQVDRRFRDFLARQAAREPLPFGRIELHLWATAVKRPALADTPAKPREPYGVAELFRQCLDSARLYHQRRLQAARRLNWTLAGVACVVGLMLLLGLGLFLTRKDTGASALERDVLALTAAARSSPAEFFQEPLDAKARRLAEWEANPEFSRLPADLQQRVRKLRAELTDYQSYKTQLENLANAVGEPRQVRSEAELAKLREGLEKLAPPPEYAEEWAQTEAVQQRADWLKDVDVLENAVARTKASYEELIKEGKQVLENTAAPNLPKRAKAVLEKARELPDPSRDQDKTVPGSRRMTYETVFHFTSVAELYRRWKDDVRKDLEPLAKLDAS
jgi:hypothetical protein